MVEGDLDDRPSLDRALEGVDGVFYVQQFREFGTEGEVRQGKALADAAKAAGVSHYLVYSSVGSAHRETGIPHFDSKWEVEEHSRGIELPYTVLRPTFFMQNWEMMREGITGGTLRIRSTRTSPSSTWPSRKSGPSRRWLSRTRERGSDASWTSPGMR